MYKTSSARAPRTLAFFLPAALLSLATAVSAQQQSMMAQHGGEVGASERVDYSGKLRMLSQRVVASGCNLAAGIAPDESAAAMLAAKAEFETILDALEFGNSDLGIIGEETKGKTKRRIGMVRAQWEPVARNLAAIDAQDHSNETVSRLADDSAALLEMAKLLVVDISGEYSDPFSLLQSSAIQIDISGRERMLTQRMSKNICLVSSGVNVDQARGELAETADLFEKSLNALRGGLPSAGVAPPPNPTIGESLNVVLQDWTELKPFVEAVLSDQPLDADARATVFRKMDLMTADMNAVVGHYSEASKLGS